MSGSRDIVRVADESPGQTYTEAFQDGTTAIQWRACTNPGDTIDEDCITVQRPFAEIRSK